MGTEDGGRVCLSLAEQAGVMSYDKWQVQAGGCRWRLVSSCAALGCRVHQAAGRQCAHGLSLLVCLPAPWLSMCLLHQS